MDMLKLQFSKHVALSLILASAISPFAFNARAHGLYDFWDAGVTSTACMMGVTSGWKRDEEYGEMKSGPVTVTVYISTFHPGGENTVNHVKDLNPKPYIVKLQFTTTPSMRISDIRISQIEVLLGTESVSPILDTTWEKASFPVAYLGGNEASHFVEMLEDAISPIISVTDSDSNTTKIPVSTKGFRIARAMMNTRRQEVSNPKPD